MKKLIIFSALLLFFSGCATLPTPHLGEAKPISSVTFNGNAKLAFEIARNALINNGISLTGGSQEQEYVSGEGGISAFSWGELVAVYFKENENNRMVMWVVSKPKLATNITATDWTGKVLSEIKSQVAQISTRPKKKIQVAEAPHEESNNRGKIAEKEIPVSHSGTGFILNPNGYLITNYHIVKGRVSIKIKTSSGDIEAKLIMKDATNDIAILKLDSVPSGIQSSIILGDSSKMKAGDKVSTIGYPFSNILGQQPRYSEGIINSLYGVQDDPRLFQISVPIQPGNSGGPLFNEKGEVIGITVSSLDAKNVLEITGAIPQNVNFAVKSAYIKNLLSMMPDFGSAMVLPTDLSIKPRSVLERTKNNIVLIEAK